MKALYISQGQFNDYQCDILFHGLRTVLGNDLVDVNRIWAMYKAGGGGYTLYGLLPDDSNVDRSDIVNKIRNKYFDVIIYGSIWHSMDFWDEVSAYYPANKIAFVDGLDDDARVMIQLAGKGIYFKREPRGPEMQRFPIQFGIPAEKIQPINVNKIRVMAPLDPEDRSTYGYLTEKSYYEMYALSYFGKTMKKGGWDCLRHYEIIACGCLPYFIGIEDAPSQTMEFLPRPELLRARTMKDNWNSTMHDEWLSLMTNLQATLLEYMTTEAVAKRLLERLST